MSHHVVDSISRFLLALAEQVPLGVFVFLGSLAEEIISPIPPALVVGVAGSLAHVRELSYFTLMLLAGVGCAGKTIGAALYYAVGDQLEDFIIPRFGRYLGVTHADIERFGRRFTGKHWKDGGALFLFRLLPFMPSTVVSLAAGAFKMERSVYLGVTAVGYFFKDLYFIALGYTGFAVLRRVLYDLDHYKLIADIVVWMGIIGAVILVHRHRHKGPHVWRWFRRLFRRYGNSQ